MNMNSAFQRCIQRKKIEISEVDEFSPWYEKIKQAQKYGTPHEFYVPSNMKAAPGYALPYQKSDASFSLIPRVLVEGHHTVRSDKRIDGYHPQRFRSIPRNKLYGPSTQGLLLPDMQAPHDDPARDYDILLHDHVTAEPVISLDGINEKLKRTNASIKSILNSLREQIAKDELSNKTEILRMISPRDPSWMDGMSDEDRLMWSKFFNGLLEDGCTDSVQQISKKMNISEKKAIEYYVEFEKCQNDFNVEEFIKQMSKESYTAALAKKNAELELELLNFEKRYNLLNEKYVEAKAESYEKRTRLTKYVEPTNDKEREELLILRHVEFYFSDFHIKRFKDMQRRLRKGECGRGPGSLSLRNVYKTLPKIKTLCNFETLKKVVQKSDFLEYDPSTETLKRLDFKLPDQTSFPFRRTVFVFGDRKSVV